MKNIAINITINMTNQLLAICSVMVTIISHLALELAILVDLMESIVTGEKL